MFEVFVVGVSFSGGLEVVIRSDGLSVLVYDCSLPLQPMLFGKAAAFVEFVGPAPGVQSFAG